MLRIVEADGAYCSFLQISAKLTLNSKLEVF